MGWLRRLMEELTNPQPQYGTRSTTLTGEHVRSKAEQTIADYLTKQDIAYQYEKTAKTNTLLFKENISRPDFFLPDYGVYIEYWGLLHADDSRLRKNYERTMKWKMAQYHKNNIKFVSIYPNNLDNLDWIFRTKFKEVTGFDLPRKTNNTLRSGYCSNCGKPIEASSRFCGNCGKRVAG
jgi:zinc ribbon protein